MRGLCVPKKSFQYVVSRVTRKTADVSSSTERYFLAKIKFYKNTAADGS